ncbi:putative PurR-regulated permease PerM [Nocardiopsis sp. Huas11]|uniref:AI-2E family transporter n=1 Tax=Nocardiopsis sp. Huas11 TaxID=2183912 RepID=UPI000EB19E49|nr:AI-2E family transporter [Nocardiopsis sp. Huas11]RKS07955.1 putative PurR-regulated permease PerM [Nocardiopsis sp. Huas11]
MQAQRPGVWALLNKWIAARRARAERLKARAGELAEDYASPAAQPAEGHTEERDDVGAGDLLRSISDVAWRMLVIGVVAGLLIYALTYLSVVTLPVIIAVFLTALLMPLANWLRRPNTVTRNGLGRGPSTAITVLFGLLVFSGVITMIVGPAVSGFGPLVDSVTDAVVELQNLDVPFGLDPALITEAINSAWAQAQGLITENTDQLLGGAWTATTAVFRVLLGIVLIIVLTVYFVHSGDKLMDWIATLLPPRSRPGLLHAGQVSYGVMGRYVRGVAMVGLFDAVGIGIALVLLIDTNLAIPLIVLTFVGAFLPIIGAFLTGLLAALVAFVTEGWGVALIVVAVVVIVQQLESNVFAPRIYGQALELPSAVVLIALTVGGIVGSVPGLFLATPIAAVLAALLRNRPPAHPEEHAPGAKEPQEKAEAPPGPRRTDEESPTDGD